MSYAASLLATYPSSYGPSTLLSDDLVNRSSYDNLYQKAVPYMTSGRLLSDDLAFNQMNYDTTTTYRPSLYPLSNSTSVYPTTTYQNSSITTDQRKNVPTTDSFASLNDITEYSESLGTASNTNTASSVARSINDNNINGPINQFSNYQQNNNPQFLPAWNSPPTKPKGQKFDEIKTKSTFKNPPVPSTRKQPFTNGHKKSSADDLNDDDITPVQSPQPPMTLTKQQPHLQRNATITEIKDQSSAIDIQAWVNDTDKVSPVDNKVAEQAWSVKIGQLHMVQAQREKEKAKSSRALPTTSKKVDNKSVINNTKSISDTTHQVSHDSHLDLLFDGDFFRKPLSSDYTVNSSIHQPIPKRNKLNTTSFNNSNLSKNPKYVPQRKTPRYEPPTTTKRVPPSITTTSWRKQLPPKQYHYDSIYPYYAHDEVTHRDAIQKDTDERFREALQKLRADRAEQQQKDINEKTAKRLHYGDYVRHSTKDALLQNAVKPSPWSDFMDLKKGNLYSLSKEEKQQLYHQSKSYGERIRYRNFAIHYGDETARSHYHSLSQLDDSQEPLSGNVTPRQTMNNGGPKSISRTSKRPDSGSTNKSHIKQTGVRGGGGNRTIPNQTSRTSVRADRSNLIRPSDDEYENLSDLDTNRKYKQQQMKKKNVRYAKYDSFGRTTTSGTESENEVDNHNQRNGHTKNRDMNDDLFTVREEKTLESFEGARYKKR